MDSDVLEYSNLISKEADLDDIYILEEWLNKLSKKRLMNICQLNNIRSVDEIKTSGILNDIRYTTINILSAQVRTAKLYFIFRLEYMNSKHLQDLFNNSYKDINVIQFDDINTNLITKDFDKFINFGFLVSTFSLIESSYRVFHNHIVKKPTKTRNISSIFEEIAIESKLTDEERNAFCLFKNIRNLIHFNGIHTNEDLTIAYRERIYNFRRNKAPDFVNLFNLLIKEILPDNITILNNLVNNYLSRFKKIEDPFANSI
jgi:hypothetical protein